MKRTLLLIPLLWLILSMTGCKGKDVETSAVVPADTAATPVPSPTPTPTTTPTPEPTPDYSGMRPSALTGEWIDLSVAERRHVAVVINNMRKSLPQSGISQAGVIYEVLAEGDITRLIAIFDAFDSPKIGTVRSVRDYFIDFALNHDALFVHHGGSDSGYAALKRLGIERLDGQSDDRAFWRDKVRVSQPGMYEHSSYTNAERILAEFERKGARMSRQEDFVVGWGFSPIEALPADGAPATKVVVPFSENYRATFDYDAVKKVYSKTLGTSPQMDEETDKQLQVTNVLIQLTKMHIIAGDAYGRRDVDTVGQGTGYLVTGGEYVPVTWKKESRQSPTMWYDAKGNRLRLNIGKTWICVYEGEVLFE